MDTEQAPLPDADAETSDAAGLDASDWLADLDRYYQDEFPDPRRADEFTVLDWRDEMSKRRGQTLHRNQASTELGRLMEAGKVARRRAKLDGHWVWLYSFCK